MSELLALGLSHKTAPLELRERLALPEGRAARLMAELTESGDVFEATVVSTCNRTEIYVLTADPVVAESSILSALSSRGEIRPTELVGHLYSLRADDVARHLFRVTAGLESMIVGESEIQGQVKRAHELALVEGVSGPILNRLFRGALAAGGRARNETGISRTGVSMASVAVEQASRTIGDVSERRALIIGAGETSELVAGALRARGAESVFVANRHLEKACDLAQKFGGTAAPLTELSDQVAEADLVVSATMSPHHLIDREMLEPVMAERADRPVFLVDLAVPRDIDPRVRDIPGVALTDVDELQVAVARNIGRRESEARLAEHVVENELELFERWMESLEVMPVVVGLREKGDEVIARVLAENENRWGDLSDRDRERVETLARTIVGRMLHEPTVRLKEIAGTDESYEVLAMVRDLFGLDAGTDPGDGGLATVTPIRKEGRS